MIMIEEISKQDEPNMKEYYDKREKMRDYYVNDVKINPNINDLCSQILRIRDKYKCVEGINLDTSNYKIEISLDNTTESKVKNKIFNEATTILDNYIDQNINEKDNKNESKSYKLYDTILVGNSIRFML